MLKLRFADINMYNKVSRKACLAAASETMADYIV